MSGPRWSAAAAAVCLTLATTLSAAAQPVRPGRSEGLGLTGPSVPPLLKAARGNPYTLPEPADCPSLLRQIADLDQVLGPDLDTPQMTAANAPDLMAGVRAILPYGGVVRLLTGANHREHALVDAALAGWERRGFLKGTARMMRCQVFVRPEPPPRQAGPSPAPR